MIERIGSGGYGEVWLCRNVIGTLRAVKIVRRAEFDDERPYEREFNGIRKFEPISRTHEGFVNILQIGRNEPEGFFYYVMELADNSVPSGTEFRLQPAERSPVSTASKAPSPEPAKAGTTYFPRTLASEVKSRGALPLDECIRIAVSLSEALAELHRHDLVHRDIKPSNIIFVNGAPKLADIGLVTSATDSRSFVGTEGFIPPEGPGTVQADLYSLGIVLYVLATGKHHRDFPEPPENLATRADSAQFLELTAIIHKSTQSNPRHRYQSAEALLADLQHLQSGHSIKRRHSFQRTLAFTAKGSAVLLALLIIGIVLKRASAPLPRTSPPTVSPWLKDGTTNVAAWEARQRSLKMAQSFTPHGLSNAVLEAERAVALDPNYVGSYLHLANILNNSVSSGFIPPHPALNRAEATAQHALKLGPNNALAYTVLAQTALSLTYDFDQAEFYYRKALSIAPNDFFVRNSYALNLCFFGRLDESKALVDQMLRESPDRESAHFILARIHGAKNELLEALKEIDEAIRLLPEIAGQYLFRGELLWLLDRKAEAARSFLRNAELNPGLGLDSQIDIPQLMLILANGDPIAFQRNLTEKLERSKVKGGLVSCYDLARCHARLGNRSRALDYLEQMPDEKRGQVLGVKTLPIFRDYHDHPRFLAVLRRLGLHK